MSTIIEMYERFNRLSDDIDKIEMESIEKNKEIIIDTLTDKQLIYGIAGDGGKIGEYRNPLYKREKQQMNSKAGGFVDLKLTGDFYSGMTLEKGSNLFLMYSKDSKAKKLEKQYSSKIYDLTNKNKNEISQENILPVFLKEIRDGLRL
jgi:hypothetical protein